jgi:hypothetical protein
MKEYLPNEQIVCCNGHPQAKQREPAEHDIMTCAFRYRIAGRQDGPCDTLMWVLQLDGGRRIVIPITAPTARLIRQRRMRPAEILDMLGVLKSAARAS